LKIDDHKLKVVNIGSQLLTKIFSFFSDLLWRNI